MKFKSVEPNYTGGNIYVFTGEVDNNFFMADTSWYDVRLLNGDPNEPTDEVFLGMPMRNMDSVEWQEEHLVKDLNPDEKIDFFKAMLKWVKENEPDGNYLMSDMDWFADDLKLFSGEYR